MSGELYFDFKVKPNKKNDLKTSENNGGSNSNRAIAVARELRRATPSDRSHRSPASAGMKNKKATTPVDNNYYRGLDRNVWKLADYANTGSVKEAPVPRGTSPSWEDYVPYSANQEVFPIGHKPHQKKAKAEKPKHKRKKHSKHRPRSSEYSLSPGSSSSEVSEDSIQKKSPPKGNIRHTKSKSKLRAHTPSFRGKSKHHSQRGATRQRIAKSASSEIEVDIGSDENSGNSMTDLDPEACQFQGDPNGAENNIIPQGVSGPPNVSAVYKKSSQSTYTWKEILLESIAWALLILAMGLALAYRNALPPLNCAAPQNIPETANAP